MGIYCYLLDLLICLALHNQYCPGSEQKNYVHLDFPLLAPEHSTSCGRFYLSEVLLEIKHNEVKNRNKGTELTSGFMQ
jgi:hypothetical protein